MRYIGLDLGTKTLGISISDETKTIASPFKTIRFSENNNDEVLDELKEIVKEFHVEKIILGLPKNMNNTIGDRALETMDFQKKLNDLLKIDVVLQDERLSTVSAHNYLLEANVSRKKRKGVVDKEKGMLK